MLTIGAIVLTAAIPLLVYLLWLRRKPWFRLTGVVMTVLLGFGLAIGVTATQAVVPVGYNMAVNNKATDVELYDAYEAMPVVDHISCVRDGDCANTYTCDVRDYDVPDGVNKDGSVHYRHVHEEHKCPYTTQEDNYYVDTTDSTVGRQTIAYGRFPANYRPYRYDSYPGSVAHSVGVGPPQAWLDAQARYEAHKPGLVVAHHQYVNWILASQNNLRVKYMDAVKQFSTWKLLPDRPDYDISPPYSVNKVFFEGAPIPNERAWRDGVPRFAAALGLLQGDFDLVIVNDPRANYAGASTDYAGALITQWQRPQLGRWALSKNGFVVMLGTDGTTVTWAALVTGMPKGNEALIQDIHSKLAGKPLDPTVILGDPQVTISPVAGKPGRYKAQISNSHRSPDSLEDLALFGPNHFVRQCMECKGVKGANQLGYSYLKNEVVPDGGQVALILLVTGLLMAVVWLIILGIVAYIQYRRADWDDYARPPYRRRRRRRPLLVTLR